MMLLLTSEEEQYVAVLGIRLLERPCKSAFTATERIIAADKISKLGLDQASTGYTTQIFWEWI